MAGNGHRACLTRRRSASRRWSGSAPGPIDAHLVAAQRAGALLAHAQQAGVRAAVGTCGDDLGLALRWPQTPAGRELAAALWAHHEAIAALILAGLDERRTAGLLALRAHAPSANRRVVTDVTMPRTRLLGTEE